MRILAYIMISTNRIFESAHGPEIPNFLEIVAGLYSIGLPRRLLRALHRNRRPAGSIPRQYPSIDIHKLVVRARQMASVAQSNASESQTCGFNSCQGGDLKFYFLLLFLVTKVFKNKCTVYKFPLDNFHLQYPSNIIHYPHNIIHYPLRSKRRVSAYFLR